MSAAVRCSTPEWAARARSRSDTTPHTRPSARSGSASIPSTITAWTWPDAMMRATSTAGACGAQLRIPGCMTSATVAVSNRSVMSWIGLVMRRSFREWRRAERHPRRRAPHLLSPAEEPGELRTAGPGVDARERPIARERRTRARSPLCPDARVWRRKEHLRGVNTRTGSAPLTMGRSTAHTWYARLLVCVVVIAGVLAVAAPAFAVDPPPDVDDPPMTLAGATVENTDPDSPPLVSEGAPPELRAEAPIPALGVTSTAGPEDDLAAALDRLAAAATAADAQAEIALALAILDGTRGPELADRAYEGIPLLNAGPAAANVRDVPGGGTVEIREVRFGDQAVFDTAGLRFLDPTAPFTIRWKITEVGPGFGRLFAPTVLLSDGAERAGQHQALEPLGGAPVAVGRDQISRFHPAPGAAEETRVVTRTVDVEMPPAGRVRAIVDPSLTPGQDTFGQIVPAADLRPAADVDQIAAGAPERQIHDGLAAMDPVGALQAAKTQAASLRALVGTMRSRHALPGGSGAPEAELQVVLMNKEADRSGEWPPRGRAAAP